MANFDGNQFSVSKEHKSLVCESSDLMPFREWLEVQMQPSINIYSNRLKSITTWNRARNSEWNEDIVAFIYVPSQRTLEQFPELRGWEVHILND